MKMRSDFRLPLSRQALRILAELKAGAGKSRFVFPAKGVDKHLHPNRLNVALRRIGYSADDVSAHGFDRRSPRSPTSRKWSIDAIELSLAHAPRGVRGIDNRSRYWNERVALVQWYADHLDELRGRGEILELPARGAAR